MDEDRVKTLGEAVVTTAELVATGLTYRDISADVRRGVWHRVRRGAYVPPVLWAKASEEERHVVRMHAVHRSYGRAVAFSHVSGALAHGLDVWGIDLRRVHVTRLDGSAGRTEPDIVHHEGLTLDPRDVVEVAGLPVLSGARTALETGLLGGAEAALVVLDSALHRKASTREELETAFDVMAHWPRARRLVVPVRMADGDAQSVGETRSRYLFFRQGVPMPVLQFEVRDAGGSLLGTTDFAWPERRVLGEFDGRVKYGRLLLPGQSPSDVVFAEKRREDTLRRVTGFGMVRLVWADLGRPEHTGRAVADYLGTAA